MLSVGRGGQLEPLPYVIYLTSYPLWIAGLLLVVRRRRAADRTVLIDAAIVTASAGLLAYDLVVRPAANGPMRAWPVGLLILYPLFDTLLIGVLARLFFYRGPRTPGYQLLVAGLALLLATDTAYAFVSSGVDASGPTWLDAGYMLFYLLWAAAALSPVPEGFALPMAAHPSRSLPWRLAPLFAAALAVPVVDLANALRLSSDEVRIAIGSITTIALILARFAITIRRAERNAEDLEAERANLRSTVTTLEAVQSERGLLLDRIVQVTEDERGRIAVELHDGPIQHLTSLMFRIGKARGRLRAADPAGADAAMAIAEREIGEDIAELRRLMSDLRPPALENGGLEVALRDQVDAFGRRSGTPVTFESSMDGDLALDVQIVLYRIMQEALTNTGKHANTKVEVLLSRPNNHAVLEIRDDGVGFDRDRARELAGEGHFGLAGMAQRASMVGGTLQIRSAPGRGTAVLVQVPARSHPAA